MELQIISIIAIILSPVVAFIVSVNYQNRKEKKERKYKLFSTLMVHRKLYPETFPFADAMNQIDIIYYGNKEILDLWKKYYQMAILPQNQNHQVNSQIVYHTYLDLLLAMAKDLGYKKLSQTDIDKFYFPQSHIDQVSLNMNIQNELYRVLLNTDKFILCKRNNDEILKEKGIKIRMDD